jgi:hypothetical protein
MALMNGFIDTQNLTFRNRWKCFFVTATKSGKLQDEAYTCFLDSVIKAIHEER